MRRSFRSITVSGVLLLALGGSALAIHDADVTDEEAKCQQKASIGSWRFFAKKAKCIASCQKAVFDGSGSASDCVPPFAGSTQGCVNGIEGKTSAGICKACGGTSTPECYAGGNCQQTAEDKVGAIEDEVDALMPEIFCTESGTLEPLEFKCELALAKYLGYFAAAKAKCFAKCRLLEHKGIIPPGGCTPGAVNDPTGKIVECLNKINLKTAPRLDRYCDTGQGGDAPECHSGRTSGDWIALAETAYDDHDAEFYCGSPSGAFLE